VYQPQIPGKVSGSERRAKPPSQLSRTAQMIPEPVPRPMPFRLCAHNSPTRPLPTLAVSQQDVTPHHRHFPLIIKN
jgi:hypothetical protein